MSYKKITCVIITALIILSSTAISTVYYDDKDNLNVFYDPAFIPENITLQDDAFHRPTKFFHLETWYFDASLDKNMSLVMVICLFQIHTIGFILHGFYLYNNSILECAERGITSLKKCLISYTSPFVKLGDTGFIKGWIDNETDQWKYTIEYTGDAISANLLFTKTANGWKGSHALGWWLAIPNFSVHGTLLQNNTLKQVSGRGYHDHNMYPVYVPFTAKGYHFGSVGGEILRITWARLEMNNNHSELFALISKDETNFSIIDPNDFSFQVVDSMYDQGVLIPKTCRLLITTDEIHANLTFETVTTHFIKGIGLKYWRYHLNVTGFISSESTFEDVHSVEMSELLKFFA